MHTMLPGFGTGGRNRTFLSGIAVVDATTDELIGILPSSGGHHDSVIIPTTLEHMKHTRSCTL